MSTTRATPIEAGAARAARVASRQALWVGLGVVVLLASALAGLLVGPVDIAAIDIVRDALSRVPGLSVPSPLTEQQQAILWEIRLPRVVLAGIVGGTLALCGAAYQSTFRNPLADPYLLGVASGAGLGATVAIVFFAGAHVVGIPVLPLLAFAGGVVAVLAALGIGRSLGEGRSSTTLILGGVAVAAFLTAIQTFVQQGDTDNLRQVYDWILGRLATSQWDEVRLVLPYVLISAAVILLHGRLLDVLGLGDDAAESVGVNAGRVRLVVVTAVTLGTAAAVAVSGLIGFVGIIIPHVVRLLGARGNRALLPLSLILGAAFLILCDLVARTALSPAELPIGVVTAVIGAPVFALVLRSSKVSGS